MKAVHKNNIPGNRKNILLHSENTIRNLTGRNRIILPASFIILLSLFNILFMNSIIPNSDFASALSYQSSELVSFTFAPTVQITISDNLTIPSLSPGDGKDSNIITVTASSNAMSGYTLSSTVGDSTTHPTNELRKDGTNTTYKFTNLTSTIDSLTNFNDNEWGYSYCASSNDCTSTTSWISGDITITDPTSPLYPTTGYNGLPLYTTETPITLINSTDASTNSVQFKIGARASTTQVAGEYTNIINFIGIANDNPSIVYMQDATLADCGKTMVDSRDNNVYSTALVGDRCWMTTNLNLPGGTKLTHNDTDMSAEYEEQGLPVANGFLSSNRLPESSTVGFDDNTKAFVYNSGNVSSNCSSPGCYSYYSWTAATIGSGLNIATANTDAPHSICPKGWHLPNTRNGTDSSSDYRALIISFGGTSSTWSYDNNTTPTGATLIESLSATPFNILRTGYYKSGKFYYGQTHAAYWSSTSYSRTIARDFAFYALNNLYVAGDGGQRGHGAAIRCVLNS